MIRPYGSRYYVRLLEPERETAGGIALPETAVEPVHDALVLAVGPGDLLVNGERSPMQAQVGDRVICEPLDFYDLGDGTGFVADSRLVARIPGPEHDCVLAANDYVLLEPERKGRVELSAGGVAVAHYAIAGQDARSKRRGDELHDEFVKLEETERWKLAPSEYERHRICWDFLHGLAVWEREALGEAIKRNGRASQWRNMIPWRRCPEVRCGTVVDVGAGTVMKDGWRDPLPLTWNASQFSSDAFAGHLIPSRNGGVGARVHLDREYRAVSVFDGARELLAVRACYLAAVEAN